MFQLKCRIVFYSTLVAHIKLLFLLHFHFLISTAFRPLASLSTLRDHEIVWGAYERRQGARGAV